jgi:hypothetical protein
LPWRALQLSTAYARLIAFLLMLISGWATLAQDAETTWQSEGQQQQAARARQQRFIEES